MQGALKAVTKNLTNFLCEALEPKSTACVQLAKSRLTRTRNQSTDVTRTNVIPISISKPSWKKKIPPPPPNSHPSSSSSSSCSSSSSPPRCLHPAGDADTPKYSCITLRLRFLLLLDSQTPCAKRTHLCLTSLFAMTKAFRIRNADSHCLV